MDHLAGNREEFVDLGGLCYAFRSNLLNKGSGSLKVVERKKWFGFKGASQQQRFIRGGV